MEIRKNKISYRLIILIVFLAIVVSPDIISVQGYYADIEIKVDSSGFVDIEGSTNHPDLLVKDSPYFTSKDNSFWILNITKKEIFSDFIFKLTLPEKSSINYVGSSGYVSIGEDQNNLVVRGFGENSSFSLIVQYQIEKNRQENTGSSMLNFFLIVGIVVLTVLFFLIYFFLDEDKKYSKNNSYTSESDDRFKGLNERQRKIMKLLIKSKTPLTQKDIQKSLDIPKASVSRNVRRLELKGLIEKEKMGISNIIRLKK
ncbi:MAG: MarR family transcriptional regulator [Candidatus Thermoplasmatota archaeon]